MITKSVYKQAFNDAVQMLYAYQDLEIRSALKQAGSDNGIEYGEDMGKFVHWSETQLGLKRAQNDY